MPERLQGMNAAYVLLFCHESGLQSSVLSCSGKMNVHVPANFLNVILRQSSYPFQYKPVVEGEDFEAYDTGHVETCISVVFYVSVSRPWQVSFRSDHGKYRVPSFIKCALAENQGRPSLDGPFLDERERNDNNIPRLTNHGRPLHLPGWPIRPE
jgi:hypothetical protein